MEHTIAAFASAGGVTEQTQIAYEKGSRAPDADYLLALYERLGIDVQFVVTGRSASHIAGLSQQEAESIARYRTLPRKVQRTVDDVLLLAWLAYDGRRGYHDSQRPSTQSVRGSGNIVAGRDISGDVSVRRDKK